MVAFPRPFAQGGVENGNHCHAEWPLVGVLLLFSLFIGLQEVLWPLVVAHSAVNRTMPIALLALKNQFAASGGLLAAAVTLFALPITSLFPPALLAFQLLYLDRLALRAGAEE